MNIVAPRPSGSSWPANLFLMAAALLFAVCMPVRTYAGASLPPSQLIVILDSSSSMEDQLDHELKYKLVRRALGKALPLYDHKLQAGLLVFGSRQKRSCADITRPMAPTPIFSTPLSLAVKAQKPLGKSPIGAALVKAANMTSSLANRSDILLIADGSDNCRVNICTVAKALAKRLPETRIHLIGLGRTGSINRLDCITKATNGLFFAIRNQTEMVAALKKVMQAVTVRKKPARPSLIARTVAMLMGPPPPPTQRPPHRIAKYQKPPAILAPNSAPIHTAALKAVPAKAVSVKKRSVSRLQKTAPKKQPTVKPRHQEKSVATKALPAEKTSSANKKAAPLVWHSFSNKIPRLDAPRKTLQNRGKPKDKVPAKPIILAGNLPQRQIASNDTPSKNRTTGFLGKGANIKASQPANTISVRLAALITEEGKEIENGLVWRIYNAAKSPDGRYKLVKTLEAPRFTGALPPGVYLVNLSWGRSHLTEKLELLSSKPLVHNFVLNAGGLKLGARHMDGSTLPAQKVVYRIYSDERDQFGQRRLVLDHAQPNKTIRLNAGIYHISSLYGSANGIIESDITIEAGKLTLATINHTASKVTFRLVNTPGGEALAGTIWRVETPDGKLVKETAGALPTLILAAGDYAINAKFSGRVFARKVTIEPGAPVHVEIVIQ